MTDRVTDRMTDRTLNPKQTSRAARALAPLLTSVAAKLLATVIAGLIAGLAGDLAATMASARAQTAPAATAVAAADTCLAAPNGPSPNGSHWRYHVERHTGRKCWYLRAQDGAVDAAASVKPRATVAPVARAPRTAPAVDVPQAAAPAAAPPLTGDSSRSTAPAPPTNSPAGWPSAPALQSFDSVPAQLDNAAPPPAPAAPNTSRDVTPAAPSAATDTGPLEQATPQPGPARPPVAAPAAAPVASADDAGHAPALLGIAFAIIVIIVGSLAIGSIARLLRRRRGPVLIDLPEEDWQSQMAAEAVVAGPAAVRPLHDEWPDDQSQGDNAYLDRLRASRNDQLRRYAPPHVRAPQPEPERPPVEREQRGAPTRGPRLRADREAARILDDEDNVRELLTRLRAESQPRQPQPKPRPKPEFKPEPKAGAKTKPGSEPQPPADLRAAAASRASRTAPPLHSSPVGSVDDRAAALYAWRGSKR